MRGINRAVVLGTLGAKPKIRVTATGIPVAQLSIATNQVYRDVENKEHELTEWHRVLLYGRLAEIARDYLVKGSKVYVEGQFRTRKWEDKNNNTRYFTEIIISTLQILDSKKSVNKESEMGAIEEVPSAPTDYEGIPY